MQRGEWMSRAVNWRWLLVPENSVIQLQDCFFRWGGQSRQLPSFMLIKDMPNCIEGIFGTLINKIIVMDEVWLALCLGPMDTEEGFINTYTCHPRVYKSERVSERDRGKGDVFVYMPCSRVMPLLVWLRFPLGLSNCFLLEASLIVLRVYEKNAPCLSAPLIVQQCHLALMICVRCGFPPSGITAAGRINVTH